MILKTKNITVRWLLPVMSILICLSAIQTPLIQACFYRFLFELTVSKYYINLLKKILQNKVPTNSDLGKREKDKTSISAPHLEKKNLNLKI